MTVSSTLNESLQEINGAASSMLPLAATYGIVGASIGCLLDSTRRSRTYHYENEPRAVRWGINSALFAGAVAGASYMAKEKSAAPLLVGAAAVTTAGAIKRSCYRTW